MPYQPTKAVRDAYEKLAATQKTVADIYTAAGENLDFNAAEVLKLTGHKDSKGAVEKVQELNKQMEAEAKEYERLRDLDEIGQRAKAGEAERKRPAHLPPLPGADSDRKERSTLGSVITNSRAMKDWRATKSPSGCLDEGFGLKALMTTSSGWAPESTRIPGLVIEEPTRPIQVLDLIPTHPTGMAAVVYMEETTRTHSAAERTEGAAYAESTFILTQQSSTVRSIGDSVTVTDEQLEDVAGVEGYLNQRLTFGIRQRLDSQVLVGDGVAPNLTGLTDDGNTGLQTQAKGADPVPDAVYKAMVLVRVTGRAFPNAFVVHPNDWRDVRLLRTADGIYIFGSPSEAGPERLWGNRVVQSDALSEGTGLVGDFANFCALYERRGVEIQVGYVSTQFIEGERTIRAGLRVAFVSYRGAAFCTVTGI